MSSPCRLVAMFTSSASEWACILRIILPRCAFTVISEMPSVAADLFVEAAGDHQVHDFAFAAAEGFVALLQCLHLRLVMQRRMAAPDGLPNGVHQHVARHRLGEKFHRAGLHGLHRGLDIGLAAHENNRHLGTVQHELLQLEAAHAGELFLDQQTTGRLASRLRQEFFRGCDDARLVAGGADARFERLAHRGIVIDDVDNG